MTDTTSVALLEALTPGAAAQLLTDADPDAVRGFLDLDPVTQNVALLATEITRRELRVMRSGDALLGWSVNPWQARQVSVATTTSDPAPLRALLAHLHTYRRCTSFVSMARAGGPAIPALTACGFTLTGVLPDHLLLGRVHHDVLVHHVSYASLEG